MEAGQADPASNPIREECVTNEKYEITDIAHEQYPFLHRIRALRDIGDEVKAGDLGGFVESEANLSYEQRDDAWIFNDAIVAGEAVADKNAVLRGNALACGCAYVSRDSAMFDRSRAENDAYLRGAVMRDGATASGNAVLQKEESTGASPVLSGNCRVYGTVRGAVQIGGSAVLFGNDKIENASRDTFVLTEKGRKVLRDPSRDVLRPVEPEEKAEAEQKPEKSAKKRRGTQR